MDQKQIEHEFNQWIALLEKTGNKDLLQDPYNIWLEAWSLAWMFSQKKDPAEAGSNTFVVKET
jgi:hypothetical protein